MRENQTTCLDLRLSRREVLIGKWGNQVRRDYTDYFKAKLDDKSFFVKRSRITPTPGFHEFKNTVKAKEILADLDYAKVVEPQLGYSDDEQSWYVSSWEEIESAGFIALRDAQWGSIDEYGNRTDSIFTPTRDQDEMEAQERKDLKIEERYKVVKSRLSEAGIGGDLDQNLFVNPENESFILIDLTSQEGPVLGEPVTWKERE